MTGTSTDTSNQDNRAAGALTDADKPVMEALSAHYTVNGVLGRGGMGSVYKAHDKRLGREVAIKVLANGSDDVAFKRLRSEAQALSELDHPNIVRVLGMEPMGYQSALVMEFVDGIDLGTYLEEHGSLSAKQCRSLLLQCAAALNEAHGRGIVHRDIKPSNLIITISGDNLELKVVDFGIARFVDGDQQKLTKTGTIVGSPEYISPEVCRGEKADARSDIYSLGCVLFTALTGKPPFVGDTVYDVIVKRLRNSAPPADCAEDPELSALICKCTELKASDRFQSVAELTAAAKAEQFTHQQSSAPAAPGRKLPLKQLAVVFCSVLATTGIVLAFNQPQVEPEPAQPPVDPFTEGRELQGRLQNVFRSEKELPPELVRDLQAWNPPANALKDHSRIPNFHMAMGEELSSAASKHPSDQLIDLSNDQYMKAIANGDSSQISYESTALLGVNVAHFRRPQDYKRAVAAIRSEADKAIRLKSERILQLNLQLAAIAIAMNDLKTLAQVQNELLRLSGNDREKIRHECQRLGVYNRSIFYGARDPLIKIACDVLPDFPFGVELEPKPGKKKKSRTQ